MAVIYVPQTPSFGSALGEGVSQGLNQFAAKELQRQEDLRKAETQMKALNAIRSSKSRDEAYSILGMPGVVNSPMELKNAMGFVDKLFPLRDQTPHLVDGWDPNTGQPKKVAVTQEEERNLNDPNLQKQLGVTFTAPEPKQEFYTQGPQGNYQFAERVAPSKRKPGEQSLEEIKLAANKSTQERLAKAAEDKAKAEGRSAAAAERGNERLDLSKFSSYKSTIAEMLNVKKTVGADGTISFSFDGDNEKAKQFQDAVGAYDDAIKEAKGSVSKAAATVAKRLGVGAPKPTTPPPAPTDASQSKGVVSKIMSSIKDALPAPEAPQDPKKREKNKVYNTPKGKLMWTGTGWRKPDASGDE